MIEPDADPNIAAGGKLRQSLELIDVAGRRLLDQHMLSGTDGGTHDCGLHVRRCGDDDRIDINTLEQLTPVGAKRAAVTQ